MRYKINWDALGITASVACAIHCALLPLFITSLPFLGINIIENVTFEYVMIALAFVVGAYALHHGFKHHHRHLLPLSLFSMGICFLIAKQVWHQWQLYLLPPAVILIITAHYVNHRFSRKTKH
ncbi:MerC domain-containing protein [Parasediminibacterium sp. JCM 36343]|uniref:MerC domain-containing protein n=1 Tax=Parasediminibacterium sp. JCM 36343 TaxID=3374279 RepID=UPI00397BAD71